MTPELITSTNLYDRDYCLWLEKMIQQLRDRSSDIDESVMPKVDFCYLIEELEGRSRREKREVYSHLKILLMHLLKYKYQPSRRSNSWRSTIREHRQRLKKAFSDSPSLKGYLQDIFNECYSDARELAADETGLALADFPLESPFDREDTLNGEYLPD